MNYSTLRFYILLSIELFFFPYLYLYNICLNTFSSKEYKPNRKKRSPILNENIYVNIHEWGGYDEKRVKKVSVIKPFKCGLYYQIKRFQKEGSTVPLTISITMSDCQLYKNFLALKQQIENVYEVDNIGMDFSGYSNFFNKIKDKENSFVVLTNTSVNYIQESFLQDHIDYMKNNPEVGMLGVSYCSKIIQTFIRNNFTPHIQSFYLLTTIDVLREVVHLNGGFPGENINHKLLLIRKGEINLSSKVLELGYKMAVVLEDGKPYLFSKNSKIDNAYNAWKLPFGDIRLKNKNPNRINPIVLNS